ncbi:unnamed protein product [Pseudo-nitzschia multistriata]|uniref:Serine hydrolase domain-containing protein n=1 Tax=Pseudo-nitzschia multistriata TaxID=183589 RepID=A0A448ZCZ8_9STRA|nr:unnamed protein product [Pseudo-nitzschia multistriata]
MASPSPSLLRVLCLHDAGSNSLELSRRIDALGHQLYQKHGIDLVFVDAPLVVERPKNATGEREPNCCSHFRPRDVLDHPPRAWWEAENDKRDFPSLTERALRNDGGGDSKPENEEAGTEVAETWDPTREEQNKENESGVAATPSPPRYVGLDASLLLLRQVWASSPFWGVLAVGQAAGVASLLPLLPKTDGRQPQPPAFMVFVNGGALLSEEEALAEHLHLPCLHVIDKDSPELPSAERLVRQFGGSVVEGDGSLSQRSATPCSSASFNNHVGRFLVARKRDLRRNTCDAAVLALRHELHRTEADAAQLVARHVAENPPDALMAVITPRDVGGFRDKRRGPNEDGGGAPCPSEFLLHRAKRSTTRAHQATPEEEDHEAEQTPVAGNGSEASRHHPNQQH